MMLIFSAAITSCKKTGITDQQSANSYNSSNAVNATKVPLTDLGAGTYLGFTGGLYPNGANKPSGTYATDLSAIASSITPLNINGIPDAAGGVGFIAIGASTCGILFNALRDKAAANSSVNPKLLFATCTEGATSIEEMQDANASYWNTVQTKLTRNNVTAKQVQVIYIETDDSVYNADFPARPYRVRDKYETVIRLFKIKFPNIKLVYVNGRTTTFIDSSKKKIFNTEPCPYYNGWGCKFIIEDQINQVPSMAYKGANAVAPLVTWGWYQWCNANEPRKDGFVWTLNDTSDGLHANSKGANILSNHFIDFLLNDTYAKIWFVKH